MAFPRMNLTLASMNDLRHLNHDLVFNASPMGTAGRAAAQGAEAGPAREQGGVRRRISTKGDQAARGGQAETGQKVIHGEEMLLHQGMAAFKLWTGKEAPEEVMREALVGALEREEEGDRGG